jgi:class 3 adenylate cyclase
MPTCPVCGRENPDDARFCNACGALLAPDRRREVRKIVTVLFADLVGSTALGERTDPEALRRQMGHYFDDLRAIIERHGGTVEKFAGDAVMAVFGIPVAHEDDALRAVRAASEIRAAVPEHGLDARIGVNTGEVVTGGEGETLVTGDSVNVAARLEQAAGPGEVLIGSRTMQLVRDAVRVEDVAPLTLKGKAEPVQAHRLIEVVEGAESLARRPEARLVGRGRERERLRREFADVVAEQTCRLFTLLGPAGIGKSRLVSDFLEHASGDADVLRGRCLHYGDGITYWPLVEILVALRIDPESVIGSSPEETRLAFRRLLEARASERPQIVVLDDLQWAEPVFLDVVEHVADFSRDAPIFLLCVARTELLELRPGWGGGKLNATSVLLEPLGDDEREALIGDLVGTAEVDAATRERIAAVSEGNPLFVEEMLALFRERGGGEEIEVPPTIHALLQARIDSLDADERLVIERGSVEGQVFHRGSVAMLAPEPVRPTIESHLSKLVRKELIRPDRGTFPDDEAFRFRHLLIRDAAYESLPKATRAELHERFADWLTGHDLIEQDEILGYHLGQAHRYGRRDVLEHGLDRGARRGSSCRRGRAACCARRARAAGRPRIQVDGCREPRRMRLSRGAYRRGSGAVRPGSRDDPARRSDQRRLFGLPRRLHPRSRRTAGRSGGAGPKGNRACRYVRLLLRAREGAPPSRDHARSRRP